MEREQLMKIVKDAAQTYPIAFNPSASDALWLYQTYLVRALLKAQEAGADDEPERDHFAQLDRDLTALEENRGDKIALMRIISGAISQHVEDGREVLTGADRLVTTLTDLVWTHLRGENSTMVQASTEEVPLELADIADSPGMPPGLPDFLHHQF